MSSLLAIVNLIVEMIKGAKSLLAYMEQSKDDQWFKDSTETFRKLKEAKTPDERKAVAADIAKLMGRL